MSKLNSNSERARKRRKLSPPSEVAKVVAPNQDGKKTNSSSVTTELPSVKDLASSESALRRAAMKNILSHLKQRPSSSSLSLMECLQIWKGFFVAIYMHDSKNALSVQNLLREVAGTFQIFEDKDEELRQINVESASDGVSVSHSWLEQYHTAFWQTLVKEWAGIDSHRINKYLLLVRFVVRELAATCLRSLSTKSSSMHDTATAQKTRKRKVEAKSNNDVKNASQARNQSATKSIITVLEIDGPLNPKDRKIPDGLRLHLLDIYATEVFAAVGTLSEESSDRDEKPDLTAVKNITDAFKIPVVSMTQSDSGAMSNIRRKAKEALEDYTEKEEEMAKSV